MGVQYQNQLLGMQVQTDNWQPILKLTKHQQLSLAGAMFGLNSANGKHSTNKTPSECGRLAVAGAQSLIRRGSLDLQDWRNTWESFIKSEFCNSQSKDFSTILNPSECAIAALPAVIFFHENRAKLREKLLLATEVGENLNTSECQTGALAVGYPIARAIKERLNPATAISQTITYLKTENALTELLSHVQVLLERGADLETVATQLYKTAKILGENSDDRATKAQANAMVNPANFMPIALAFYCFLSTPEDWRLSVVRAARCGIAGQLTCALTGALSGAYNGIAAIPVEWRQALSVAGVGARSTEGRESSFWGADRDGKIVELATQLFAVWAGVCSSDKGSEPSAQTPVVTAPYVIRPHKI